METYTENKGNRSSLEIFSVTFIFPAALLELMMEEVKQHLVSEVPEYSQLEEEDPAMRFIRSQVGSLLQIKIK